MFDQLIRIIMSFRGRLGIVCIFLFFSLVLAYIKHSVEYLVYCSVLVSLIVTGFYFVYLYFKAKNIIDTKGFIIIMIFLFLLLAISVIRDLMPNRVLIDIISAFKKHKYSSLALFIAASVLIIDMFSIGSSLKNNNYSRDIYSQVILFDWSILLALAGVLLVSMTLSSFGILKPNEVIYFEAGASAFQLIVANLAFDLSLYERIIQYEN